MTRPDPYELTDETPIYVISVAAQLSGLHPQTLRQYERLGLVAPDRTADRGRRYSARDIELLRQVEQLSQGEGINLAGIKRIIEMQNQVAALQSHLTEIAASLDEAEAAMPKGQAGARASHHHDVPTAPETTQSSPLIIWRPGQQQDPSDDTHDRHGVPENPDQRIQDGSEAEGAEDEALTTLLRRAAAELEAPPPREEREADRRELLSWMQGTAAAEPAGEIPAPDAASVQPRNRAPHETDDDAPVYALSAAAEMSGLDPHTVRQYDRIGLVRPARTPAGIPRWSARDIELLRQIQQLSQDEGINLAGIKRIIELQMQVAALLPRVAELQVAVEASVTAMRRSRTLPG